MKVVINGYDMNLKEGDEVYVAKESCECCGSHTEISVYRNYKRVAYFGDGVRLFEPEKLDYGDVYLCPPRK